MMDGRGSELFYSICRQSAGDFHISKLSRNCYDYLMMDVGGPFHTICLLLSCFVDDGWTEVDCFLQFAVNLPATFMFQNCPGFVTIT